MLQPICLHNVYGHEVYVQPEHIIAFHDSMVMPGAQPKTRVLTTTAVEACELWIRETSSQIRDAIATARHAADFDMATTVGDIISANLMFYQEAIQEALKHGR